MFLRFYGLREQPFSVTPDPNFLYMGPAHQEAFASLMYGIETGRGFMALIAAPGMGKTTIILRLMEQLRNCALTALLFQTHTDSRELLKNLLLDLDVEPTGQDLSDLQAQLREVLIKGSQAGKRLVLVIDEAQNLDDSVLETVRMLSNFETPQSKLLQIILAGQPALAEKLARPHLSQLRQRISIVTHFPPLAGDEVETYIQHRLRVAGYNGSRLFTAEALALIARHSKGIPRVINNLCFNALTLGYAKDQRRIDGVTVREVIADLNLDSLREHHERVIQPSAPQAVSARRENPRTRPQAVFERLPADRRWRTATPGSFLDDIDVSGHTPAKQEGGAILNGVGSGPYAKPKSRRQLEVLVFLAIAASVFLWKARWLKPSLDFIEESASGFLSKPEGTGNLHAGNGPAPALPAPSVRAPQNSSFPAGNSKLRDNLGSNDAGKVMGDSPVEARNAANSLDPPDAGVSTPGRDAALPAGPNVKGRSNATPVRRGSFDDLGRRGLRGELIVQCGVSGARISLNGRSDTHWVTPHLFSLVPGAYTVSISKNGYLNWTRRVQVEAGKKDWVLAELADEGTGILTVETEPSGMQVFIDGRPYGVSRVDTVLGAGWHTWEVIPPSGAKPVVGKFHLAAGEALTKRIRVRMITAAAGSAQTGAISQPSTLSPKGERLE